MHNKKVLLSYLHEEIFPQFCPPPYGKIEIQTLCPDKPVFLFIEKNNHLLAVGKYFKRDNISLDEAWFSADREYANLRLVRDKFGMGADSYKMIAPLGEKKELAALLVTQKASGVLLDHYIARAIFAQQRQKLFQKLGYLARFFFKLHGNSITRESVSSSQAQWYLNKLLRSLRQGLLGQGEARALEKTAAPWWHKKEVCERDMNVIVHGDATPTNFFLHHQDVIGIDLEKMRCADRCWDLGFIAAELKHHFWWRTGDRTAAEPFIGHFLWEYAVSSGDTRIFHLITAKLPLYMALGLLRIARNTWLNEAYRKALTQEAGLCLHYGL